MKQTISRLVPVTFALSLAVGAAGCKSEVEKCRERNLEVEARQIAACKDEACKQKAAKDRKDFDEACDSKK